MRASAALPLPTPPARGPFRHLGPFSDDRIGFLTTCARQYGDFVPLRFGHKRFWFVSDPAAVNEFLVTRCASFSKTISMRRFRDLFGNGLLVTEGAEHSMRRRMIAPGLKSNVVRRYGEDMQRLSAATFDAWEDGARIDLHNAFSVLVLKVVVNTLLGSDLADMEPQLVRTMADAAGCIDRRLACAWPLPLFVPTSDNRRLAATTRALDTAVSALIEQRREAGTGSNDLLQTLLSQPSDKLGERNLCDEVKTLLLAGFETTANCLAFTCWLLGNHRTVLERVGAEVRNTCKGGPVGPEHLQALPSLSNVIAESLRLYPPVWLLVREATEQVELGGRIVVRRGEMVAASPYVMHRDPRWFNEPEAFRPERFGALFGGAVANVYYPFGLGPRGCVGSRFANLELGIILATLLQRIDFHLVNEKAPALLAQLTLRPGEPIAARITKR
jgi:cytochrome P450